MPVGVTLTDIGSTSVSVEPRSMLALKAGFVFTVLTIVLPFFLILILVVAGVRALFRAAAPAPVSFSLLALMVSPKPSRATEAPARLPAFSVLPPTLTLSDLVAVLTVKLFSVTDFLPHFSFRPPLWVTEPVPVGSSSSPPVTGKVTSLPLNFDGLTSESVIPAFFIFLAKAPLIVSVVVPPATGLGAAADANGAKAGIARAAAATIATGSILPLALPSRVESDMYSLHCVPPPAAAPRRLTASRLVPGYSRPVTSVTRWRPTGCRLPYPPRHGDYP